MCGPSGTAPITIVQIPVPEATALPVSVVPSRSSTVVPGSAVPLNATVLVISSALLAGAVDHRRGRGDRVDRPGREAGVVVDVAGARRWRGPGRCGEPCDEARVAERAGPNAAPSSEHWNVELPSVDVKVNVALVLLTDPRRAVSDRRVRRRRVDHERLRRGRRVGAPLALSARTSNVCVPSDSGGGGRVRRRAAGERGGVDRHWKPDALTPVNVNVGVLSLVGFVGPSVRVVSSAATVNERVVVGPVNGPLTARTVNV